MTTARKRAVRATYQPARWLVVAFSLLSVASVLAVVPRATDGPYLESYLRGDYQQALDALEQSGGTTFQGLPFDWAVDRAELLYMLGRNDDALLAMRDVVQYMQEPFFTLRFAEMLRECGRKSDAEQVLQWAEQQFQSAYERSQFPLENLLAMGRLARLRDENPNRVLQFYEQRILSRDPVFAPAFIEAGELALSSYAYDVSEGYFSRALELEAENQDALAGLADTYWKAGDPRFDEVKSRLEALNIHHPRLQGLVVARALASDDLETADMVLKDMLGINPNQRTGLAYQGALAFLREDVATMEATLEQLKALDPARADGYWILGEMAARRYRFRESVEFLRKGLEVEPDNVAVQSSLGLNLLRLGEDDDGRAVLEKAFDSDRYNVQLYNMLEVLDTLDGFATLETADFVLRMPEEEAAVMGRALQAQLTEAMTRYEAAYEVKVDRPVHVQLFDDHDEFMVRSVGLPGNAGHLGICFGDLITLDSPRARPPQSMNWKSVSWHEFVHVITLQKTNNRIPRWLSEGISVYEEGQRDPSWGQPLQPEFAPLLKDRPWPGVGDLEAFFIRPESSTHLLLGYFLAGAFVQSYVDNFGMTALVATLDRIRDGEEAKAALANGANTTEAEIDTLFAAHLKNVCKPLRYLHHDSVPAIFIPKIKTPSFYAEMEAASKAMVDGDTKAAQEHYEAAADLFPWYPGEESPLQELVKIHQASGEVAKWAIALRELCRYDSAAYEAPRAYLENAAERGAWNDVEEFVGWCLAIDPFDVSIYQFQRRAREALGQQEALLETLSTLASLDTDQAEGYRLDGVRILMALGRRDEARQSLLEILEQFPEYQAAQEVLLALHNTTEEPSDGAS